MVEAPKAKEVARTIETLSFEARRGVAVGIDADSVCTGQGKFRRQHCAVPGTSVPADSGPIIGSDTPGHSMPSEITPPQRHWRSQWQRKSGCHHGFGDARVCCRSNHKRSYRKHSIVRKPIPATAFTAPANCPSIPCVRDNVGCDLVTFVQSRIGVGLMEHPANLIKWRTLPLEGEHHELRRI